jgi:hypothetical protein
MDGKKPGLCLGSMAGLKIPVVKLRKTSSQR